MKQLFTILVLLCYSLCYSQDGLYFHPQIGGGAGLGIQQYSAQGFQNHSKLSFTFQGQIDIDYTKGKWHVISGIGYLQSGSPNRFYNGASGVGSIDNFIENNKSFDPHIVVPVKLGYSIHTGSNSISFLPELGAACSYGSQHVQQISYGDALMQFNNGQNNLSFIGIAQFNMQYRVNERYSLTCGPTLQYMLTSILFNGQPCDCTLMFNAGMRCKLNHKKIHKTHPKATKISNNGSF